MDSIMRIFLSCLLGVVTIYRFNERCMVSVTATKSDKSNFAMDQYESILQDATRKEKSPLTASENLGVPMTFLEETDNQELLLQSKAIIDDSPLTGDLDLSSKLTTTSEAVVFQSVENGEETRIDNKLESNVQTDKTDDSNQIFHSYIEKRDFGLSEDLNSQVDASLENATEGQVLNESDSVSLLRGGDFKKTAEPEDIPSFSEWTQKQLAEKAEKKKTDQNGTADRFSKRGKFRNKNYASPDCGAKIVAANPEAVSSGSVLSSLKDEYMLNYCTNRIWFIVELCEAIQMKQLDLANFELFSSSPREFSVFLSHRFPTRDWSNVGKFTARDSRDVQTFDLDPPHLFGKFVKVELHSHYGKEQFCPISWVGIYGTSEFEVLAKEDERNPMADEDDGDTYDEELFQGQKRDSPKNLFSSATDAVLSIVKKATAPFMKTEINETETKKSQDLTDSQDGDCFSPRCIIVCNNCSQDYYDSVFQLLSCQWSNLEAFLSNSFVRRTLIHGEICARFGLDFTDLRKMGPFPQDFLQVSEQAVKYLVAMVKKNFVPALCNVLAVTQNRVVMNATMEGIQTLKNLTRKKEFCEETNRKSEKRILTSSEHIPCNAGDCVRSSSPSPPPSSPPSLELTTEIISDLTEEVIPSEHHPNRIDPTKTLTEGELKILSPSHVNMAEGGGDIRNGPEEKSADPIQSCQVSPTATMDSEKETEEWNGERRKEEKNSFPDTKPEVEKDAAAGEGESNNGTNQENTSLESIISDLNAIGKAVDSPSNTFTSSSTNLPADSIFLRLANRIKNLEINMSLSSTYLEELSRRYRIQLELLSKTLNLTIQKVEERSKLEEEKERRREKEMLLIRMQLANLTRDVTAFVREKNSWKPRASLVSQHLLFITIEILLVWLVFNYWKRPAETNFERSEAGKKAGRKCKRRSSLDVKGSRESSGGKTRRPSDEALNIALSRTYQEEPFKLEKKRKKRKKESKCSLNGGVHLNRKQSEFEISETCLGESLAFEKSIFSSNSEGAKPEVVSHDPPPRKTFQLLERFPSAPAATASVVAPASNPTKSSAVESSSSDSVVAKTFQDIAAPIFIKTALAARNSRTRSSLDNQSSHESNFDRRDSKRESEKEKKSSSSLKKYMRKFF